MYKGGNIHDSEMCGMNVVDVGGVVVEVVGG
jgi:hypothetical protein